MYRGTGFSGLEWLCLGTTLVSALLAAYGAFVLVERLPRYLGLLAAFYIFTATCAVGYEALKGMVEARFRQIRKQNDYSN
jgi:DMSO/TMAO reductase YedYZ heme-binding membrane subunit